MFSSTAFRKVEVGVFLYLGHVVSMEGVAKHPDKVAAVRDWRTPNNLSEL